ncbi:protein mono-ADP-ribosyltransferase PARP4 isoform X1 [Dasypus novemcinctus]|uniref:protein mono-ADP-ribosyltransferase PARP4 isoform X1 n=2 Tax=Dasypus novemcinctus TaxID=9361 RepID=UPI00266030AD|nr:protein mono-ADP-ribosyltransferase PARP4 isoform X1 [Dasypus novemcinctus]
MTVGIFADCTFCLKVKHLPRQQKQKLQTDIYKNGGKISFLLNPPCTHVILDNVDVLSEYQLKSLQKKHIHIANPDFIWESIKERRLLDVKNYVTNRSLDIMLPPGQKARNLDLETDDLSLDNSTEKENVVEPAKVYEENAEIPYFPHDFEVAKYNALEKIGAREGENIVVVELQCSQDPQDRSFLIAAKFLSADGTETRGQFSRQKTSADACEYYENYIEELKKRGFLVRENFTPKATQLASENLQALLLEDVISSSTLSQEVSDLVEMIWTEALGHLEHTLLKPVNRISLNDVSKAEGILLLAKTALKNGETTGQLQKIMAEFYRLIPHKGATTEEVSLRLLSKEEDLCQLIRDMVNVCETNLSKPNPPSLAKYRALRCKIEHVDQNTEEFCSVREQVLQNNHSKSPVDILQIFRVGKVNETTEFLSKLGNVKSLLHGSSVRNIVGILSRGLLLPKVIEDHGVNRTDIGNLGSGIYFSDSLSTSIKYSHPGETEGTRLLVICDVALGKCMDLYKKDFSLTEAPPGYDSVHGVSEKAAVITDFEDDEFVVYKTNQIKMKYIVKFCIPGDPIKDFHPGHNIELEEDRPEFSNVSKVEDYQLPDSKPFSNIKAGLQDISGNSVPLEDVHIKGRIIDFVAQVVVFQTYTNQSHVPIEAKYIFPLDDKAAVCGFEAFINGKHIVGEIKEKEEAHREYREAITQGHGAYLMDQDAPDVFTVSVGNLPPKAKVLIKITYITELSLQGPLAIFFMPATVAPWQQDKALNENLQETVEKICIKEIGAKQSFSLSLSIEMPYVIGFISSDTHKLKQKRTDCKAVISTMEGSSIDSNGFSLHISLSDAYLPRMWVEKHPEKESEACMLVFQPDFNDTLPEIAEKSEVIICLDCSNSMEGAAFVQAKQIALYALSLLDKKQKINIIKFGTGYKELFTYPKSITSNNMSTEFIMSATPTMGNTDFWKTLRYLSLLYPSQGLRNILLISDGHVQNEGLTLQLVRRHVQHTRLFTCGVGSTANRHILRTLSQCGAGVFEYFNSKSKHSWKKQVEDQVTRVRSPSCHSISVKWQQLSTNSPRPVQAPAQVRSLFHNDRLLVYGFIPHCTQATLCALIQKKEFCTMVSTTELQKTTGTMIHKLTARAVIRDYEDGILHDNETHHEMKKQILKSLIIKISKENSLITQFTSFVAVEKRDGNESLLPNNPNILELITKEDVDFLPYMSWQEEQPEASITQSVSASSEWNEELQHKPLFRKKLKSFKQRGSENLEVANLGSQQSVQPLAHTYGYRSMEKPLDLSWMDSFEKTEIKEQRSISFLPQNVFSRSSVPLATTVLSSCHQGVDSDSLSPLHLAPQTTLFDLSLQLDSPPRPPALRPPGGFLPASATLAGFGSQQSKTPGVCAGSLGLLPFPRLPPHNALPPHTVPPPPPPRLPSPPGLPPPPPRLPSSPGLPPPPRLPSPPALPFPPMPLAQVLPCPLIPGSASCPASFGSQQSKTPGVCAGSLELPPPPPRLPSSPGLPPPPPGLPSPPALPLPPMPLAQSPPGAAIRGSSLIAFGCQLSKIPGVRAGSVELPPPPRPPSSDRLLSPSRLFTERPLTPIRCIGSSSFPASFGPQQSKTPGVCAGSLGLPPSLRLPAQSPPADSPPGSAPFLAVVGSKHSGIRLEGEVSSCAGFHVLDFPPRQVPTAQSARDFSFPLRSPSFLFSSQSPPVSLRTSDKPSDLLVLHDKPGFSSPSDISVIGEVLNSPQHHVWTDSNDERVPETQNGDKRPVFLPSCFLQKMVGKADATSSDFTSSFQSRKIEDDGVYKQSWMHFVPWTELFNLQTEDGFWKLTPELGFILKLNTKILNSFLEEKGIRSLGLKGRECLLCLIATFLVLQFVRTRLTREGIVFKSLMKLDDTSNSRCIPWAFEKIKKASEWVRRTEGQYPSVCPRFELGKDWEFATKQLLGIQPINITSPLHKIPNYSEG